MSTYSFTFSFGHKTRIGTLDGENVFAKRIAKGKQEIIAYYVGDGDKPVPLKSLSAAKFLPPLTPKTLEGINSAAKRTDALIDLVVSGVRNYSYKRYLEYDEEGDGPAKKKARTRAAKPLSKAPALVPDDKEAAQPSGAKDVSAVQAQGDMGMNTWLSDRVRGGKWAGVKLDEDVFGKEEDGAGTGEGAADNKGDGPKGDENKEAAEEDGGEETGK